MEVVDFLKNPGKFAKVGANSPRGVLLATGKRDAKFYKGGDLEYDAVFGARDACATNQNPALFIRAKADSSLEYVEGEGYEYIKFGLYDLERSPAGGWTLLNEMTSWSTRTRL